MFDILIIGDATGKRARYHPQLNEPDLSIAAQMNLARCIGWKPLYAIKVFPKPGHDWVVGLALANRDSHA